MVNLIPLDALMGGALLGVSALLLLISIGKIAGISGIVNGVVMPTKGDLMWRVVFIASMVAGGLLSVYWMGASVVDHSGTPIALLVIAGLLVGAGTKIGNGCTSGHGICGIGRLSKRSIVATLVFMLSAAVTVAIRFHG